MAAEGFDLESDWAAVEGGGAGGGTGAHTTTTGRAKAGAAATTRDPGGELLARPPTNPKVGRVGRRGTC